MVKTLPSRQHLPLCISSPTSLVLPAIVLVLTACIACSQQSAAVAAPTLPPAWTPSPSPPPPTPTPSPSPTPRPTSTPSCDIQETLRQIKASIPYEESAVHFVDIGGTASLGIWYVDPALSPRPQVEELPTQLEEAILRAAEVSAVAAASSPCTARLFDVINPIVVDGQYQGWFSGQLSPESIPTNLPLSPEEVQSTAGLFNVGYERTSLGHRFSEGSCRWPEARDRLQSHFSSERELVAFYFVIDDLGPHVWVQWDGSADPIMSTVNLGNVFLALECFSPQAEIIYMIVDESGTAQLVGVVPNGDPSQLRIVYP